jgi:hypothetical protein
MRSDRFGWRHQVELTVSRPLVLADAVAYFITESDAPKSIYLGSVSAPGVYRFPLAGAVAQGAGTVAVFSASSGEILGGGN